MASQGAWFMVFLLFAAIVPMIIQAKDYVVGDDQGWTIGVDYQAWANGKEFHIGDRLIFKYPPGAHNVFKVNATAFRSCTKPPLKEALTSGNDAIVLLTPGWKWYICGVGDHCVAGGQKLVINVQPQWLTPSPAPWPSQSVADSAPWAAQKRPFIRFFRW